MIRECSYYDHRTNRHCNRKCVVKERIAYRITNYFPDYTCPLHTCECVKADSKIKIKSHECRICYGDCCEKCDRGCNCDDDGQALPSDFISDYCMVRFSTSADGDEEYCDNEDVESTSK